MKHLNLCLNQKKKNKQTNNNIDKRSPTHSSDGNIPKKETYRSGSILVDNLEIGHGFDDGHNGLNCVTVDNCSVLLTLLFWVAILVNNPGKVKREVGWWKTGQQPLHNSCQIWSFATNYANITTENSQVCRNHPRYWMPNERGILTGSLSTIFLTIFII